MENQQTFYADKELRYRAGNTVSFIEDLIAQACPQLTMTQKIRLILECLIEVNEERKFLRRQ